MRRDCLEKFSIGIAIIATAIVLVLAACTPVRFHQKALLSDRMLRFDADPLGSTLQGHMITPREGAIGGFNSVSAGGCSCK